MQQQLLMGTQLTPNATFANYYAGENDTLLEYLRQFLAGDTDPYVYLWGEVGTGRSHLLQAICHQAHAKRKSARYYPLAQLTQYSPEILIGIEEEPVVCIDDVDTIAGNTEWEEALFNSYNRLKDAGGLFVIAGSEPPKQVGFQLPDLVSRLCWGVTFQVKPLVEEDMVNALQFSANLRGFELPEPVVQFLLTHCARQQGQLFSILARLDQASLVEKRKLTIPFVKQILEI